VLPCETKTREVIAWAIGEDKGVDFRREGKEEGEGGHYCVTKGITVAIQRVSLYRD
jgi:hypothetical protein